MGGQRELSPNIPILGEAGDKLTAKATIKAFDWIEGDKTRKSISSLAFGLFLFKLTHKRQIMEFD